MPFNRAYALQLLRLGTQNSAASFRDGQEAAIRHVVDGHGRLLVVQKTGWGKSSVYFIATKLLREQGMTALDNAPDGLSINELLPLVNARRGRIDKAIQLMALESPAPIAKAGSKWTLTAAPLTDSFWERADRLTTLRRAEQRQMQEYASLASGHMEYLIRALDGDPGVAAEPPIAPLSANFDADLATHAVNYLRRTSMPIEPRRQWPTGGLPQMNVKGNIPEGLRAQEGRMLSIWSDAGWGTLVRQGKSREGRFADQLVEACAVMVRAWNPQPAPAWITCIPSRRHPDLVPDFARRLAAALALPFHSVLQKTDERAAQKEMANSSQQARNIDGSLSIQGTVPTGAVLLMDDMVDSRWTMTVAAYLLKSNGSGPVFPLALASTANSDE